MSKQYKYGVYGREGRWAKIRETAIKLTVGELPAYLMEDQSGNQIVVWILHTYLFVNTIEPQGAYL